MNRLKLSTFLVAAVLAAGIHAAQATQFHAGGTGSFPEIADISKLESKIGKFYRITTIDHLLAVLEQIEAEARRDNAFSKRPTPEQIENLIRGKKV